MKECYHPTAGVIAVVVDVTCNKEQTCRQNFYKDKHRTSHYSHLHKAQTITKSFLVMGAALHAGLKFLGT